MLTSNTVLFLLGLLLVSALLEPLAKKLRIPFSIVLVVIGYIGSEVVIKLLNVDTGIRWHNFHAIIFYLILPILIFQAAIEINLSSLKANLVPILVLALPLMVVSAGVTAIGVYYGIGHASGFPWIAALITGALLSATDPAAVMALLKKSNAPERINMLLEGESLFNDATAIVLFTIIIAMALTGEQANHSWSSAFIRFLSVFLGGLTIGALVGISGYVIIRLINQSYTFVLITLAGTYTSYLIAEDIFHFSGVMAVLSTGLILGSLGKEKIDEEKKRFVNEFWNFSAYVAEALIFILAGVTITLSMFTDQWLAILIGIAAVIFARVIVIFGIFPAMNILPGIEPVPVKHQIVLAWGGVRGTVTLALALSLPLILDYWYTIQSIAYGVVLFTLFFQATTMNYLINKLNIQAEH